MIRIADLDVDTNTQRVARAGRSIELTAREYAVLEYLAHRRGEPVTRTALWEHVYDFEAEPNSNVIDVYVGQLRKKLEEGGLSRLIHTRRGVGYVLEER